MIDDQNNTKFQPKIVYEDQDILVIDKPAGLIVNKADTTRHVLTVQDWIDNKFKVKNSTHSTNSGLMLSKVEASKLKVNNGDFYTRSGIVHRIDKETSGLLLVAKNEKAFENLQLQFKEGRVEKIYTALVYGKMIPEIGEIIAPIARLPWNRMRFGVIPMGRQSQTNYKVVAYYKKKNSPEFLSLLEAYPRTGRTHQVRVHLKYQGFPLFADLLYAGKLARRDRKILPRHFLHASKLSFTHPVTGEKLTFSSDLPNELEKVFSHLEKIE